MTATLTAFLLTVMSLGGMPPSPPLDPPMTATYYCGLAIQFIRPPMESPGPGPAQPVCYSDLSAILSCFMTERPILDYWIQPECQMKTRTSGQLLVGLDQCGTEGGGHHQMSSTPQSDTYEASSYVLLWISLVADCQSRVRTIRFLQWGRPLIALRCLPLLLQSLVCGTVFHHTSLLLSPSYAVVLNHISSHFLIPLSDSSLICTVPAQ